MRVVRVEDVDVDFCSRCGSMWLDAGELSAAMGLEFDHEATGRALAAARAGARRCPACAIPLREREIDAGSDVLIDQCPQCSGIFLDSGEFSSIRDYFAATGTSLRRRRKALLDEAAQDAVTLDEHTTAPLLERIAHALSPEADLPQRAFSPAVVGILAVCVVALLVAKLTGMHRALRTWALVPTRALSLRRLPTLLTYMLLHGGWLHLLGNAYFLWVAGDNVEERLGWKRFLGLFILSGLLAGVVHVLTLRWPHPCAGIGGGVSGVIGAYCGMFPYSRFVYKHTWHPFLGYWWLFRVKLGEMELPMYVWFGLWFAVVLLYWDLGLPAVSLWGHLAAFTLGVALGYTLFSREEAERRRQMAERFRARHRRR